ncbi:hypothetical protein R5R35_006893 [Gryllus longicercus]|uniref:p53 DNA-binding domain-containing protein n=1 Tax=Gryllus longicercus TaxID=2509291 RepID=A0AAN9Z5S2_9ORTH
MDNRSRDSPNLNQCTLDFAGPSANEIDLLLKSEQLYGVEDFFGDQAIYFAEPGLQISPFEDLPDSTSPQQNPAMPFVPLPISTSAHPSMVDYPGPYHFEVEVPKSEVKVKWEHSVTLNKLFVAMNTNIPFKIKVNPVEPELYVRVLPIYLAQDSFAEAVKRCPSHMSNLERSNQDFPHVEHIIRCLHNSASYQKNLQSGRCSVVVPIEPPQPGSDGFIVQYTFMCKNSCGLGMNRRSTAIIFTLERQNGEVIGRKIINLRSCSSPRRDRIKEEQVKNVDNEMHCSQIVGGLEDQKIQRGKTSKWSSESFEVRTPKKFLKIVREMILMDKTHKDLTVEENKFLEEVNKHLH